MKVRMLSLLASVAMFGAVSAASSAEPITLTENQLDAVSAGAVIVTIPGGTFTFTATPPDVLISGSGSISFTFVLRDTPADMNRGKPADMNRGKPAGCGKSARSV